MGRGLLTFIGLAVVALLAIYVARVFIHPAKEEMERETAVLTRAYDPQVEEFRVLEDHQLEDLGIEPPAVGEDALYATLVLLYPGAAHLPEPDKHALDRIGGRPGTRLEPVQFDTETDESGFWVYLVFRVAGDFDHARLVRGDHVLIKRVSLE